MKATQQTKRHSTNKDKATCTQQQDNCLLSRVLFIELPSRLAGCWTCCKTICSRNICSNMFQDVCIFFEVFLVIKIHK